MITIYKYELDLTDRQEIRIKNGANILDAQIQDRGLCIWAEVNTEHLTVPKYIRIYGTGHPIKDLESLNYIGTVQIPNKKLVFHVYLED